MRKISILNRLLATTIICGAAAGFAAPAHSQTNPEGPQTETGPIAGAQGT